jgi:hypothetical protein
MSESFMTLFEALNDKFRVVSLRPVRISNFGQRLPAFGPL